MRLRIAGGVVMTIGFVLSPASAMNDFGGHMPMTDAEIVPGVLIVTGALALVSGAMWGMSRVINAVKTHTR